MGQISGTKNDCAAEGQQQFTQPPMFLSTFPMTVWDWVASYLDRQWLIVGSGRETWRFTGMPAGPCTNAGWYTCTREMQYAVSPARNNLGLNSDRGS
jgi:hypothetical protein